MTILWRNPFPYDKGAGRWICCAYISHVLQISRSARIW